MRVRDVMTVEMSTVSPETPVKEVVALLLRAKVSGLPVLDEGRLVGMVSGSDLLPLDEGNPGHPVGTAGDVMNRTLISLAEDMSVAVAARVLQRHQIKRAPVMRGEALVGIVTRTDLLRPYLRTDSEIRMEAEEAVGARGVGLNPRDIDVRVADGVVTLDGSVADERTRAILLQLVRGVDGVVDLVDHLESAHPKVPA